ncbi:unnamed protein product [Closterium sp. NIES-53]
MLNLWPCVSLPETLPTLRWIGEVGDASVFRVWGSRSFVRDTSADKLSSRAILFVFLAFPSDAPVGAGGPAGGGAGAGGTGGAGVAGFRVG